VVGTENDTFIWFRRDSGEDNSFTSRASEAMEDNLATGFTEEITSQFKYYSFKYNF
jgi:hypothetical protein